MSEELTARSGSDADARRRIRTSLDESLIVEAAAGTGKTSELVGRIVAVLESGRAQVQEIVAVTFTRKAAGELKLRLRQELDRTRMKSGTEEGSKRLELAMVRLEEAHIGTIHGFCADVLRERPVEAGIQPGFEELDEKEAPRLFGRVFRRWAETVMADPTPGVRRALDRAATWSSQRTPLEQIRGAAWKLIEWRDFPSPWRREQFERDDAVDEIVGSILQVAGMAATCRNPKDTLRQALQPTIDFKNRIERAEAVRGRDYDELEAIAVRLGGDLARNKRKGRGRFSDEQSRDQVLEAREALLRDLEAFRTQADADLAAHLRDELWELVELYNQAKLGVGKLDFVDLLIATRNLVRDNSHVRGFLQQRFTHLFVDEFQDTDPLQAEILLLLSSDNPAESSWTAVQPIPGKLFLVGDPKQSIYRFRRADVVLYRQIRETLTERGVGLVFLSRSFRAGPGIQSLVNSAFESAMDGDPATGQPLYVPLEEHAAGISGQPSAIALSIPHPYGWSNVTKTAVNKCLPATVASFIDWLLNQSGWQVRDPAADNELVPVAPRHVAILFRRFVSWGEDITRGYVHELEGRNVPHLLWGAKSFHRREEVETMRAALTAIEWPDDELSVYAALKGSLFAIPDALLLRYRKEQRRLRPFRGSADTHADFAPILAALKILARLHRKRNWQPFVETISQLLETTRAHAGFALRPAGNQVLANIYRVAHMARSYEARGGSSFRGFVEQLSSEAQAEDSTESPVLEDGAEGVRIMTVHAAKGLEFPIVVLADITANLASTSPDKHVDPEHELAATRILGCTPWDLEDHHDIEHLRDEAEGVRIAYVASTRARDLLVVPAVGDKPMSGWIGVLNDALYPAAGNERKSTPGPGCPRFGTSSVLDRPGNLADAEESSVRPGRHQAGTGGHDVVWWDPALLDLSIPGDFGIRQEDILRRDQNPDAADRSINDYQTWKNDRAAALENGCVPSIEVFTPSKTELPAPVQAGGVEVLRTELDDRQDQRPAGRRFGTLVHLILQQAALDAEVDTLAALSRFYARSLGATDEEQNAATNTVTAALRHPLILRAHWAERVHREYGVTLRIDDSKILEGVIDLAFLEDGVWNVVDFKTDMDLAAREEHYVNQINWYRHALGTLSGLPTRGYVLGV